MFIQLGQPTLYRMVCYMYYFFDRQREVGCNITPTYSSLRPNAARLNPLLS